MKDEIFIFQTAEKFTHNECSEITINIFSGLRYLFMLEIIQGAHLDVWGHGEA